MKRATTLLVALSLGVALIGAAACGKAPSPPTDSAGHAGGKWASHMGAVPFTVAGFDDGLAEATKRGKPPLFFFTTTW